MYGMVQRQAMMLSFVEAFWVMGVIFLGMVPLLFLLRNRARPASARAEGEAERHREALSSLIRGSGS